MLLTKKVFLFCKETCRFACTLPAVLSIWEAAQFVLRAEIPFPGTVFYSRENHSLKTKIQLLSNFGNYLRNLRSNRSEKWDWQDRQSVKKLMQNTIKYTRNWIYYKSAFIVSAAKKSNSGRKPLLSFVENGDKKKLLRVKNITVCRTISVAASTRYSGQ